MSSTEVVTTDQPGGYPSSPSPLFQRSAVSTAVNAGAIAIEQERAIAEVQGQLVLAKRFPRDLNAAHSELMQSCSLMSMASQAFYSVPNRGSGPSIRLAEEIARVFGNFEFGHRELSRGDGKSEVEVYAWDKQTNNRSIRQITVMHTVDTKNGPKVLRDQADIDNRIANVASKQVRGRILAMMPKWLVQDAIQKCKDTLAGASTEPVSVRVRKMTQAFAPYGVTEKHLSEYLGHSLDDTTLDELIDLTGVYTALKEGAKASEYFGVKEQDTASDAAAKLAEAAKAGAPTQATARARRAPAAAQQQPAETSPAAVAPAQPQQPEQPPQDSTPAEKPSNPVKETAQPEPEDTPPTPPDSGDEPPDLF